PPPRLVPGSCRGAQGVELIPESGGGGRDVADRPMPHRTDGGHLTCRTDLGDAQRGGEERTPTLPRSGPWTVHGVRRGPPVDLDAVFDIPAAVAVRAATEHRRPHVDLRVEVPAVVG